MTSHPISPCPHSLEPVLLPHFASQAQPGGQAFPAKLELYTHNGGRIAVMVEVSTESEAASQTPDFRGLVHEIALHIAAAAPLYLGDDQIPPQILEQIAQDAAGRARRAGKPERIVEKIVAGVLEKYKNEHVLLRQPYLRDDSICIATYLAQMRDRLGENIVVRRFLRWEVGCQTGQEEGTG